MSSNYADYHSGLPVYMEWQEPYLSHTQLHHVAEIQSPRSSYQPNSYPLQHHHQDRHPLQPTLLYQQRHPPVVNTGFHPPHAQPPDQLEWQQLYYEQNFVSSTSGQQQPDPASPLGSQSLNQSVIHPPGPPQWGTSTFSLPGAPQPLHNPPDLHCPHYSPSPQPRTLTCWDLPDLHHPHYSPPPPPRYTPDLEPNLSVAALVSQLERLTADVEQLVSRMDANERCLGDPHAAMRPPPVPPFSIPYTAPVSCPLPQSNAAAPAVLQHAPHQVPTPYFTPNSLPAAAPPYTVESRHVNNIGVSPTLVPNVVVHVHEQPAFIRVQENHGALPSTKEDEVHVPKVVDEAQDDTKSAVETPAIIDEASEVSYAPIVMHLKVIAATLLPLPAAATLVLVIKENHEFQEDGATDWSHGSYGFAKGEIAQLFIAGFGYSMVLGSVVGSLADKKG